MQDFQQIKQIIETLKQFIAAMRAGHMTAADICNIQAAVAGVNELLYHSKRLRFQKEYDLNADEEYQNYISELSNLMELWEQTIQRRNGKNVDAEFWETYEYFSYVDIDTIYLTIVQHYMSLPEGQRIEYFSLPYRYSFLQNHIDYTCDDFSLIEQHVELMANRVEDYKWLYEHMGDDQSRKVLNRIIGYWFEFDLDRLQSICGMSFEGHCDLKLLEGDERESLRKAVHLIRQEKPRLMVSVYRKPEDIFDISRMIYEIREDYEFYLYCCGEDEIWPCNYILAAL